MFDVGFSELLLIGVVALLVLGPERLPKAARMAGLWMRRARASWYSMRSELERELADEELRRSLKQGAQQLDEIKRDLQADGQQIAQALPRPADLAADVAPAPIAPPPADPRP